MKRLDNFSFDSTVEEKIELIPKVSRLCCLEFTDEMLEKYIDSHDARREIKRAVSNVGFEDFFAEVNLDGDRGNHYKMMARLFGNYFNSEEFPEIPDHQHNGEYDRNYLMETLFEYIRRYYCSHFEAYLERNKEDFELQKLREKIENFYGDFLGMDRLEILFNDGISTALKFSSFAPCDLIMKICERDFCGKIDEQMFMEILDNFWPLLIKLATNRMSLLEIYTKLLKRDEIWHFIETSKGYALDFKPTELEEVESEFESVLIDDCENRFGCPAFYTKNKLYGSLILCLFERVKSFLQRNYLSKVSKKRD